MIAIMKKAKNVLWIFCYMDAVVAHIIVHKSKRLYIGSVLIRSDTHDHSGSFEEPT